MHPELHPLIMQVIKDPYLEFIVTSCKFSMFSILKWITHDLTVLKKTRNGSASETCSNGSKGWRPQWVTLAEKGATRRQNGPFEDLWCFQK